MSTEENKAIMRRFIEAGNRQEMATVWSFIDPDCYLPDMVRFGCEPNFAGYQKFLTAFYAALPDAFLDVEDMVAEGDQVWVWYIIRGTHRGPLRGVPATNKQVSYRFIAKYRLEHGRIVFADALADNLSLLQQLDALPSSGS
jgi:steroid delta-isomerase-like uncharacterized protein